MIREICAIRGQKHDRIFTTADTEESQRLQKGRSMLKVLMFSPFRTMRGGQTEPLNLAPSSWAAKKKPGPPSRVMADPV